MNEKFRSTIRYLLDRFDEPSSWTGVAAALVAIGGMSESEVAHVVTFGSAVCAALLGFFFREKGDKS